MPLSNNLKNPNSLISTHLQVVKLDCVHHHCLHVTKGHEGHQARNLTDVHAAVHLRQLLQHTQHSSL